MDVDIKDIKGHIVYYHLEDGKVRAMLVVDGFDDEKDAYHYMNNMIGTDTEQGIDFILPPKTTIH